ncbi:hypothetical protein BGZ50_005404 [Haplosporangium sp. Z 11]|nr:hypothetical protein BGZ50_005404 [Haplosporangium sp. Z 11]
MYAVVLILYTIIIAIVFFARRPDAFTTPVPDLAPGETPPGMFNPHTAWGHLEALTTTPHPFNSRANTEKTQKYIRDQFKALQAEAIALGRKNVRYDGSSDGGNSTWAYNPQLQQRQQRQQGDDHSEPIEPADGQEEALQPEVHEIVQVDNMVMWVGGVVESTGDDGVPVEIEIDVDQESQTALLVSAHFDSAATSYGATDAGGGVAVALAMIRHFIHHPVQHTIIFNLNNAEEVGLLGAIAFMGNLPNSTTDAGKGHPWKKYVRAFVNLEGGGSGGPSLLFRASNYDIISHYADNAPFPHASVFANDVFQLGLINSDTDYSIYTQHGLPGLDIAFVQHRAMYHSTTESLPIRSLYHMGSNAQATITGLCNSDYLDLLRSTPKPKLKPNLRPRKPRPSFSPRAWFAGKSIFYDILGKQMILTDLWAYLLVNAFLLGLGLPVLTVVVVYVGQAIRTRQARRRALSQSAQQNPTHTLRSVLDSSSMTGYSDDGYSPLTPRPDSFRNSGRYGDPIGTSKSHQEQLPRRTAITRTLALVVFIVALDLGAVVAASQWLMKINPLVRYGYAWHVLFGFGLLLMVVHTLAVYLFTVIEACIFGPVPIVRGYTQWTLALGLWWWVVVLVVGTGVASWFGVGSLYGTTILAVCASGAALLQSLISLSTPEGGMDGSGKGWIFVLATSLLVPGVVLLDQAVLVVHLTAQSLIAKDIGLMYIIYGLLLIPILMPMIPIVSRGRNFKIALLCESVLLALIMILLSQVEPFTANDPASLYFAQYYNQTAGTSFVDLMTDSGEGYLARMLQDVPLPLSRVTQSILGEESTVPTSGCIPVAHPSGRFRESCQFKPKRQVFEDDGSKTKPLHVEWLSSPKLGPDGWREGRLQILALESRICTIHLAQTRPGVETLVWMEQSDDDKNAGPKEEQDSLNHRPKTLNVFLREWNRAWTVRVRVKELLVKDTEEQQQRLDKDEDLSGKTAGGTTPQRPPAPGRGPVPVRVPITVTCGYDDWSSDQGYASVFNTMRTHIPSWTRMKSMDNLGLFRVGVDLEL